MLLRLFAALLALLMLSAAPAMAVSSDGQPALPTIPLTLVTASGKHKYTVELARTAEQQSAGMMFRKAMARNRGMLFPFEPPRPVAFWMENTVLSLDLVFINPDGRVGKIAARATPFSRDMINRYEATAAVLELIAGEAARIGLRPGDRAIYTLPR